jgi:hypothetical protein
VLLPVWQAEFGLSYAALEGAAAVVPQFMTAHQFAALLATTHGIPHLDDFSRH